MDALPNDLVLHILEYLPFVVPCKEQMNNYLGKKNNHYMSIIPNICLEKKLENDWKIGFLLANAKKIILEQTMQSYAEWKQINSLKLNNVILGTDYKSNQQMVQFESSVRNAMKRVESLYMRILYRVGTKAPAVPVPIQWLGYAGAALKYLELRSFEPLSSEQDTVVSLPNVTRILLEGKFVKISFAVPKVKHVELAKCDLSVFTKESCNTIEQLKCQFQNANIKDIIQQCPKLQRVIVNETEMIKIGSAFKYVTCTMDEFEKLNFENCKHVTCVVCKYSPYRPPLIFHDNVTKLLFLDNNINTRYMFPNIKEIEMKSYCTKLNTDQYKQITHLIHSNMLPVNDTILMYTELPQLQHITYHIHESNEDKEKICQYLALLQCMPQIQHLTLVLHSYNAEFVSYLQLLATYNLKLKIETTWSCDIDVSFGGL